MNIQYTIFPYAQILNKMSVYTCNGFLNLDGPVDSSLLKDKHIIITGGSI